MLYVVSVFGSGRKFSLQPEKKDTLRPEKKDTVVCLNSESEFQQPADWNEVINQVKKLWHVV